jgi:hypothetical protein
MRAELLEPRTVQAEYARIEQDYHQLAVDNAGNDIAAELALSYAEFAKFRMHPDLELAVGQARIALERAQHVHLPLLELWAQAELLDLDRLLGKRTPWKGLADQCDSMGYPIALAYILLIARASGESVSPPDYLLRFLRRNGFYGAAEALAGRQPLPQTERGIRLAFPGLFTLY